MLQIFCNKINITTINVDLYNYINSHVKFVSIQC